MGLMDMLNQFGGKALLEQVARQAGIPSEKAGDVVKMLSGTMVKQVKSKIEDPGVDTSELENLLKSGKYMEMLEKPEEHIKNPNIKDEGNKLLSYITGSKDASRQVASEVASKSGIDVSAVKSLLPMLAPFLMGSLSKGISSKGGNSSKGLLGMLDFDNDGSIMDDITNIAKKFF